MLQSSRPDDSRFWKPCKKCGSRKIIASSDRQLCDECDNGGLIVPCDNCGFQSIHVDLDRQLCAICNDEWSMFKTCNKCDNRSVPINLDKELCVICCSVAEYASFITIEPEKN